MKRWICWLLAILLAAVGAFSAAGATVQGMGEGPLFQCELNTAQGEPLTQEDFQDKITVLVFFSMTDHNGFLTLDDIQCSNWVSDPQVQVIAVDLSGSGSEELKQFQDFYGFLDLSFCIAGEKDDSQSLRDSVAENLAQEAGAPLFLAILDGNGVPRYGFSGYQRPDDLENYVTLLKTEEGSLGGVQLLRQEDGRAALSWYPETGDLSYEIYQSDRPDGIYTLLAELGQEEDYFILPEGEIQYYKLRRVGSFEDGTAYGDFSPPVSVTAIGQAPEIRVETGKFGAFLLFTSPAPAAPDGYLVSFSEDGGESFSQEQEAAGDTYSIPCGRGTIMVRVRSFTESPQGRSYSFAGEYIVPEGCR